VAYPIDTGDCREWAANSSKTATCRFDELTVSAMFSTSKATFYHTVDDSSPPVHSGLTSLALEIGHYIENISIYRPHPYYRYRSLLVFWISFLSIYHTVLYWQVTILFRKSQVTFGRKLTKLLPK